MRLLCVEYRSDDTNAGTPIAVAAAHDKDKQASGASVPCLSDTAIVMAGEFCH